MSDLKIVVCDHGINLTQAQCLICQSPQLAEAKARIAALEARCAEAERERDEAEARRLKMRECAEQEAATVNALAIKLAQAEAERDAAVKRAEEAEGINRRHSTRQLEAERLATKERHRAEKAEADLARIRAAVESEEMETKVAMAVADYFFKPRPLDQLQSVGLAKAALAAVREAIGGS